MQRSATSMWRLFVGLVVVSCLLAQMGCGGGSPARGPTGTVSGKVTLNGAPVPEGCAVVFTHQAKTIPASGVTGADGAYTVSKALAGENKITVTPPAKAAVADPSNPEAYKAMMMNKGIGKGGAQEKSAVPKKYASPEQSGLSFTVKEGTNTFDIELKSGN